MQKAFAFKDKDGTLRAGHLETTDEMYKKIIIEEENVPLLIVKGHDYHHATPYYGKVPVLPDSWIHLIPLTNEKRRVLVLGDSTGVHTIGLLLTYAYYPDSKIFYCNPFGNPDENGSRDHESMEQLTGKTLRITGLNKKVNVYPEYIRNFLPTLKRGILDIAFVDLDYEGRWFLESLVFLWRKVRTGGYIVVNNCESHINGASLRFFLESYKGFYNILGKQNDQLILQKTEQEECEKIVEQADIHNENSSV